ncbi:hypothetical protein CVT25_004046 [Psilocybe cyanescens]|uniref:Uncharacterized protein n=1 Tax=Psilocybe cyanescens TaxID=93625 RepID=A0A409WXJ5_PSICY|nr:hypothetical protein CVT25_004046 [Psilocybe cyanescens]
MLIFSHRSYDLSSAFAILRSSLYLSLLTLHDEVQARIIQGMIHGLFHAFVPLSVYESLTRGQWGTGGCRGLQCAARVLHLRWRKTCGTRSWNEARGAGWWAFSGDGWCTADFAALAPKLRDSLLRGLAKRTTPRSVFAILWVAEHALDKIGSVIEPWADVRETLGQGRAGVDEVLARENERYFGGIRGGRGWGKRDNGREGEEGEGEGTEMEIMRGGRARFEAGELVGWAMAVVLRRVREPWVPTLYQNSWLNPAQRIQHHRFSFPRSCCARTQPTPPPSCSPSSSSHFLSHYLLPLYTQAPDKTQPPPQQ